MEDLLDLSKDGTIYYSDSKVKLLEEWTDKVVSFRICLDLDDLIYMDGMNGMNDYIDEVTEGGILTNMTYSPIKVDYDGSIVIGVVGVVQET